MDIDHNKLALVAGIVNIPAAEAMQALSGAALPNEGRLYAAMELAGISTRGRHTGQLSQAEAESYLKQSLEQLRLSGSDNIRNWLSDLRMFDSDFAIERDFVTHTRDFPSEENLQLCRDFLQLVRDSASGFGRELQDVELTFMLIPALQKELQQA